MPITKKNKFKFVSMKNSLSFDWCNMKFYDLKRRKQHGSSSSSSGGGGAGIDGATGGAMSPTLTLSYSSTSSSCSLSPSPTPTPTSPWKDKENDPVIVVQETVSPPPIIRGRTVLQPRGNGFISFYHYQSCFKRLPRPRGANLGSF